MRRLEFLAVCVVAALHPSASGAGGDRAPSFGQPLAAEQLAGQYSVSPTGAGLPQGQGTVTQGREIYASKCASCHGEKLEGKKPIGAPALVGGRGTLASAKPVKTVESYWPYATTLFDYVKRAMPFNAPGSLADDEVYAVTAYLLAQGHIVGDDAKMDATSLPQVRMPNAAGFVPDPRPGASDLGVHP